MAMEDGYNFDPNNTGGGFDWSQYTGGVTGQTTGAVDPVNPTNYGAAPAGFDAQKWADPTQGTTNKYIVGRILASGGTIEQAAQAVGATVISPDKIRYPDGFEADVYMDYGGPNQRVQYTQTGGPGWQGVGDGTSERAQAAGGGNGYNFATDDPSYKWRLEQGLQGVQKSASARGTLLTGGTLKDLNDYAQGAASTEYGAAFGRKATLADMGLRAAGGQVGAASSYGNGATGQYGNIGNANSAGSIAQGNIWGPYTNGIGQWGR